MTCTRRPLLNTIRARQGGAGHEGGLGEIGGRNAEQGRQGAAPVQTCRGGAGQAGALAGTGGWLCFHAGNGHGPRRKGEARLV